MIIQKVTFGAVVQQFDTETRKFVDQEFITNGVCDCYWETQGEYNRELNPHKDNDAALIYGEGGVDEPKLSFEMKSPEEIKRDKLKA